jgi:hypothetical protein
LHSSKRFRYQESQSNHRLRITQAVPVQVDPERQFRAWNHARDTHAAFPNLPVRHLLCVNCTRL